MNFFLLFCFPCDSRGIQTHNLLIRSQMLYSVELGSQYPLFYFAMSIKERLSKSRALYFVGVPGFEPGTPCSQSRCANRTALHPELCLTLRTHFQDPKEFQILFLSFSGCKDRGFIPAFQIFYRVFSKNLSNRLFMASKRHFL